MRIGPLPRPSVFAITVLFVVAACGRNLALPNLVPHYVVTTVVMAGNGVTRACFGIQLSLPSPMCGGVDVHGVNASSIPGSQRQSNGIVMTPPVRLEGTWNARSLTVVNPPTVSTGAAPREGWSTCSGAGHPRADAMAVPARIAGDRAKLEAEQIQVLSVGVGPCPNTVTVVIPVADHATIARLTESYGELAIFGWLTPAA